MCVGGALPRVGDRGNRREGREGRGEQKEEGRKDGRTDGRTDLEGEETDGRAVRGAGESRGGDEPG